MDISQLTNEYSAELEYLDVMFSAMDIVPNDSILVLCIQEAYIAIRKYLMLGADDDVSRYLNAACELALVYYNNKMITLRKSSGLRPVTQKTEGSYSVTFGTAEISVDSKGLTEKVKSLLPYPPIWCA